MRSATEGKGAQNRPRPLRNPRAWRFGGIQVTGCPPWPHYKSPAGGLIPGTPKIRIQEDGMALYTTAHDSVELDLLTADAGYTETFGSFAHLSLHDRDLRVKLTVNLDFNDILGLHAILDEIIRSQIA